MPGPLTGRPARKRGRFFGNHFKRLVVGNFKCELSRATIPKEDLPEHRHDEAHVILALDAGYISRALPACELGQGFDLIYNPPGTIHRDCFFEPGGRFFSIVIPTGLGPRTDSPILVRARAALVAAERALGCCIAGQPGSELLLEEHLLAIVEGIDAADRPRSLPAWIHKADDLIAARATEPHVTIAELARAIGIHPVYFARAYRKVHGCGPAKAVQRRRVRAAAALLSRDMPLSQIAISCGFADQSHLCRSLRATIGVVPTALRSAF